MKVLIDTLYLINSLFLNKFIKILAMWLFSIGDDGRARKPGVGDESCKAVL
jgi:hypothetical protein